MTLKAIIGDKIIEALCSPKKGNFGEKNIPNPSPLSSIQILQTDLLKFP